MMKKSGVTKIAGVFSPYQKQNCRHNWSSPIKYLVFYFSRIMWINLNCNLSLVLVMTNGEPRSQPILTDFQGSSSLSSLMSELLKLFLRKYRKESTFKLRKWDRSISVMWSYIKWTILAYWW